MKRIFVYEHLSGGAAQHGAEATAPELLAMGRAMRDAIAADLSRLEDYDVSVATSERARPVPEGTRAARPHSGESALDFVAREGDVHHLVWAVAPETDGVLMRLQRSVDPGRWLGCDGAAIQLASAKRLTLMRLADAGIATPLAFEHEPEITRWVVKPDDGAGCVATRVHSSPDAAWDDWSTRSRAGSPMAIEPWVDGQALSLSLLCGARRCELLSVNQQRLTLHGAGMLSFDDVEVNVMPPADPRRAVLSGVAARIARSIPGLRGFVGVDLVWHAQRGPVVIEVNPRVTCAYVGLSRALGRNLAAEVIAVHGGRQTAHGDA